MANGLINKGTSFQVCVTPKDADLTEAEFEALAYLDICCLTEVPAVGEEAEMLSQFCIDGTENTAIGASTGAEIEMTVLYKAACVGQKLLRDNAGTQSSFAFRIQRPDGVATVTTPTTIYFRAQISSKMFGSGDINEFIADVYGAKITQAPIFVEPAAV